MNFGKFTHKVTIQEPIESKGSMGGTEKNWINFHECKAQIVETSGREILKNEQLASNIIARAFMRYKADINPSMRLIHEDNIYQIEGVINKDGKKRYLELILYEFR